ncbi:MAG: ATP-binding protein [Desulfocapsaceae bacterium]|nr:ATP-binding protein [Desulfocapsaceae bacterium]
MQRHDLIDLLKELKLYGMARAYDETVTLGIKRQQPIPEILGGLCQAEAAERKVRSIRYQMGVARFPVAKDLDNFKFADYPVNEPLIRDLYSGHFLEQARNLIFYSFFTKTLQNKGARVDENSENTLINCNKDIFCCLTNLKTRPPLS